MIVRILPQSHEQTYTFYIPFDFLSDESRYIRDTNGCSACMSSVATSGYRGNGEVYRPPPPALLILVTFCWTTGFFDFRGRKHLKKWNLVRFTCIFHKFNCLFVELVFKLLMTYFWEKLLPLIRGVNVHSLDRAFGRKFDKFSIAATERPHC